MTNPSHRYIWLYILVIKSGAVYVADVYTAVALLASNRWAASILTSSAAQDGGTKSSALQVPFSIGKVRSSFGRRDDHADACRAIVDLHRLHHLLVLAAALGREEGEGDYQESRHQLCVHEWCVLALAGGQEEANGHTCSHEPGLVFAQELRPFLLLLPDRQFQKEEGRIRILHLLHFQGHVLSLLSASAKTHSRLAGWKRLLLADAPRQVINGLTLYAFGQSENWTTDLSVYFGQGFIRAGIVGTMLFTLVIWVGSAILLLIAAVMYVPLLCYIQGNLKEYCCHKVDKRCVLCFRFS